jgi:hypothetical protein
MKTNFQVGSPALGASFEILPMVALGAALHVAKRPAFTSGAVSPDKVATVITIEFDVVCFSFAIWLMQ